MYVLSIPNFTVKIDVSPKSEDFKWIEYLNLVST